jgi:hypothetical protein
VGEIKVSIYERVKLDNEWTRVIFSKGRELQWGACFEGGH